jgi:1-acyl-sn-glycerol-3-phosphate acyltransferase
MLDFVEPKSSTLLISLIKTIWPFYIKAKYGNLQIDIGNDIYQAFNSLKDQPVIVCPNHSAQEDSDVLFGLSKIISERFYFLSARELFGPSDSVKSKILQKVGCYSIERGIADFHAFTTTVKLLTENANKIVIFPEGEVSHQNDFIMDLENGAEHMALTAAEQLATNGSSKAIHILPLALQYQYRKNIRRSLYRIIRKVEFSLKQTINKERPFRERLKNVYEIFLENLEKSHSLQQRDTNFDTRLFNLRQQLIREVQGFLKTDLPNDLSQLTQIHILRNAFNKMRLAKNRNPNKKPRYSLSRKYYKQLILATNLIAIGEHSFSHELTQEEAAELLCILEKEIYHTCSLKQTKKVFIGAGNIIDVSEYLKIFQQDKKAGVQALKSELSQRLNQSLDTLKKNQSFLLIE